MFRPETKQPALPCLTVGERLERIFHSLSDGLIIVDEGERVISMNPAAERLCGLQQKTLFSGCLADCISDRRMLKRLRAAAVGRGGKQRFECELPAGQAPARVITVEAIALEDGERENAGTAFLLRDITHQREVERLKSEFICTAAHELRTPLTAIMGFSELLLTRPDLEPEQKRDFLTFIHRRAENLAEIIADLLDLSRIEAGRGLALSLQLGEINSLVRDTVQPYHTCSSRHRLEVVLPEQPIKLQLDRGKIIQVLENLLSNAFKYSPQGGTIEVSGILVPGAFELTVRDTGIGMSREEAEQAFDKFYRADRSHAAVQGTGLGLSISKYIVEAHGGRIWLESRKGKGTAVSFALPLALQEGETEGLEDAAGRLGDPSPGNCLSPPASALPPSPAGPSTF